MVTILAHQSGRVAACGVAVLAISGLAGCGVGPLSSGPAPETVTVTAGSADVVEATGGSATSDGEAAESAAEGGNDAGGANQGVSLADKDLKDRHPNGVTLQVTSIRKENTGFVIGIKAVNGKDDKISLNNWGTWLTDDTGVTYNFRKPEKNDNLSMVAGGELTGELVFLGEPVEGAKTLTLKTNVSKPGNIIDRADRNSYDLTPAMLIEGIPIP